MRGLKVIFNMLKKILFVLFLISISFGQLYADDDVYPAQQSQDELLGKIGIAVWGETPENSVYLGMLTWHLQASSRAHDEWNNQMIAVNYKSLFIGTFVNSFYDRSYTIGLMREVYSKKLSENNLISFGYRAGGLIGYTDNIGDIGKYTPIIPFAQIYAHYQYKIFGIELQYTGIIISGVFYFTF